MGLEIVSLTGTGVFVTLDSVGIAQIASDFPEYPEIRTVISAHGTLAVFEAVGGEFGPVRFERDGAPVRQIWARNLATGATKRVSVDGAGTLGNSSSSLRAVSGDGRYVLFDSAASNLVAGDTNGVVDIFIRDQLAQETERVSVSASGEQAWDRSLLGSMSLDGRYVAFGSQAENLVPGDTNRVWDVFVRDRLLGITERVSVGSDGTLGNGSSVAPSISADGRYVAFVSFASNLVPGDGNGATEDVFVRDRLLGITELISVGEGGVPGNGPSWMPAISGDGRSVAFQSTASTLVAGDSPVADVFVRDRQLGATEIVSVSTTGRRGAWDSVLPNISADGRFVSFVSSSEQLVEPDTDGRGPNVFIRDRSLGSTDVVTNPAGVRVRVPQPVPREVPALTPDGRFISFRSSGFLTPLTDEWAAYRAELSPYSTTTPPVSNPGPDPTVTVPHDGDPATNTAPVILDGSGSFDPDGTILFHQWFDPTGRPHSSLPVAGASLPPGAHVFTLRVADMFWTTDEETVTVTVLPEPNAAPMADAGPDQEVAAVFSGTPGVWSAAVSLSAARSTDPEGDRLAYSWRNAGGMEIGTSIRHELLLAPGDYTFRLRVTDPYGAFTEDEIEVTVAPANRAPVANAGSDGEVALAHDGVPGGTVMVTLSGTGSFDPDGDALAYAWRDADGALLGTQSTLARTLGAGKHSTLLRVTDPSGQFDEDRVSIHVLAEPNRAPLANAGPDQEVTIPHDGSAGEGTVSVSLSGARSSDPDGDTLAYSWRDSDGVELGASSGLTRLLAAGKHTFVLRVTDPYGATDESRVSVRVLPESNRAPLADAGPDQDLVLPHDGVPGGTLVAALSGARSSDPDGDALAFSWRDGDGMEIGTTSALNRTLGAGTHTLTLRVTDPYGAFHEDTVAVRVLPEPNRAPVANAGPDQEVAIAHDGSAGAGTAAVTLSGARSADPEGDAIGFSWRDIDGNELGTAVTLARMLPAGKHTFVLRVTDAYGAFTEDRVSVRVIEEPNRAPISRAGPDQEVAVPHDRDPATTTAAVTLNGARSSDPDGDALAYSWRDTEGVELGTTVTLARALAAGLHTFILRVTDPYGALSEDSVAVRVTAEANRAPVANAGPDQEVTVSHDGSPGTATADVTLNGSRSGDPDGDALAYSWRDIDGTELGAAAVLVRNLALGKHTFLLRVTDPYGAWSEDRVSVRVLAEGNRPPDANVGPDQAEPDGGGDTTGVVLNGSASSDPDGDPLTYRWLENGVEIATGSSPSVALEPGRHRIVLVVTDPYGQSDQDAVTVTIGVVDVTALVTIRRLKPVAAKRRFEYTVRVRVTNLTDGDLSAPVSLVLDGLPGGVRVLNPTGNTTPATGTPGQPYLDRTTISPGRTSEYVVRVRATGRFTALPGRQRVLAGIGPR